MKRTITHSLVAICFAAAPAFAQRGPGSGAQAAIREDGLDPSPVGAPTDLDTDKFINDWRKSPVRTLFGKLAIQDMLTKLEGPDPQHPSRKGAVLTGITAISHGNLASGATASGREQAGERMVFYSVSGEGTLSSNGKNFDVKEGTGFTLTPEFDFKLTATKPLEFYVRTEPIPAGTTSSPNILVVSRWDNDRRVGAHWAHIGNGGPQGLSLITVAPRTMPQPHSHPAEECWLAVKGETVLSLGKVTMKMTPGMAYKIPPSGIAAHSNINLGEEPVELIFMGPANNGGGRGRGGPGAQGQPTPGRGGQPATDYARLDNSSYNYGNEQDIDMFMGDWHNGFPRIEHGNMYFRDMLTALRGNDPLHPQRRGGVLTNAQAVSYVQLEPNSSAHPVEGELKDAQETFIVNSGAGIITSGGKKTELQKDMAFILTPGLDYKLTAIGDKYMTFYAVTEKLPEGFTPKSTLTVVDNRNKPQATNLWVDKERPLITREDGLSQYDSLTQVEQGNMTMSRPYSDNPGVEEIWIATDGDVDMLLGKELRKLPAGTAYRVPSTGITAHTQINVSGKPAKYIYMVKQVERKIEASK
jgi:mannose-6-phosphate isomerase-like protein (cupin superfamily)